MRKGLAIVSYQTTKEEIHMHEIQFFYHNFINWTYQIPTVTHFHSFQECINYVLQIAKNNHIVIDVIKDGDFRFPDIYFSNGYSMRHYSLQKIDKP